jgi:hypothetical protein
MVGAESRYPQLERLLCQRDRLGLPPGGEVCLRERVAAVQRLAVIGAERGLRRVECPDRHLDCRARDAEAQIGPAQGVEQGTAGLRRASELRVVPVSSS